jgi:hypothetical protein
MKLSSVVAIAALEAAIKRLGITLAAKTLPISMAIELGHFLIEKDFFGSVDVYDGTGAIDEFMIDFFKTLNDNPKFADNAVNAFRKVLADNPTVADIDILHFYKNLADIAITADTHRYDLVKPLTDDPSTADAHAYDFHKEAGENITDIVDNDYLYFHKALTEAPSLVDAIDTIAFFKNTQDAAGFTDGETLAFAKFLVDNVYATDDVDGAASILDDQEMQYHKNTTNLARVTEVFFRMVAYTREYSDAANFTDGDTLSVGKTLADGSLFTEIYNFNFGKLISDTPIVGDALALHVTLAPFIDSYSVSDSVDVIPNKGILENSISITDSGLIRSQDYADFSFFAEDYVGASRIF